MKKIGIIGGVGWPSTIEYYRIICEESQRYHRSRGFSGPVPMPEISIESLNMNFTINNRGSDEQDSWNLWDSYFNNALHRLEKSGAEIISIASVTPHARLNEISLGINARVLSIYEAVGLYCNSMDIGNILVLGTMPTMTSSAFIRGMIRYSVSATYPADDSQKTKVVDIIGNLYQNVTDGAATLINEVVRQCVPENELRNTAVCLGCTELPLAFQDFIGEPSFEVDGVNYINSTVVHAKSIFAACTE